MYYARSALATIKYRKIASQSETEMSRRGHLDTSNLHKAILGSLHHYWRINPDKARSNRPDPNSCIY